MEWKCIFVNLSEDDLSEVWQGSAPSDLPMSMVFATAEDAVPVIETSDCVALIIRSDEDSNKLQEVCSKFQKAIGAIPELMLVVCDDPSPIYMAQLFEFGLEKFASYENWVADTAAFIRETHDLLIDKESAEYKAVSLALSLKYNDKDAITAGKAAIEELVEYDFRAAYVTGKALEAEGDYEKAADVFGKSADLNKMYRPSKTSEGENLLVTGQVDKAIEIFEKLEKTNKRNVDRKVHLVSAHIANGDFESATKYAKEAAALNPDHPRVKEAKAQILLCSGKVGDAFKLMDEMSEVGPFFASKLNEMGIKLSQAGKGKSALALYQKAHKIVQKSLKHKVSLNAALACYRLKNFPLALKFLVRCEKEFGETTPKMAKIKAAIKSGGKGSAKPAVKKAG